MQQNMNFSNWNFSDCCSNIDTCITELDSFIRDLKNDTKNLLISNHGARYRLRTFIKYFSDLIEHCDDFNLHNIPEKIYILLKKYLDYIVLLCKRAGVSVDDCFSAKSDFLKENLLCRAVEQSNQNIIKLLLEYGLSPNSKNEFGETSMHRCSVSNNVEIAQLLFNSGALLEEGDEFGVTPLHVASYCYSKEMVGFLLKNGANPNSLDFTSSSALHKICSNKDDFESQVELGGLFMDICAILCYCGADINSKDCDGNTPLDHFLIVNASKSSSESIKLLEFLLAIPGIDSSIKNPKGEDALSITNSLVQVSESKKIVLDWFNRDRNVKPAFLNNASIFNCASNEENIMHF